MVYDLPLSTRSLVAAGSTLSPKNLHTPYCSDEFEHLLWCPTGGCVNKLKWLISWPILVLLYFTIPNCAKPRWERFFMLSFCLSTLWIAVFSYFMVWMVS